ncbi:MAG: hypothetical protein RI885_2129 [Actinomycetota bacterium]
MSTAPSRIPNHRRPRWTALSAVVAGAVALTAVGASPAIAAPVTQTIAAVQGTASASPLVGTTQTVEGIVTADYRGASGYQGIVIQTIGSGGATDATPGASDGLFVFLGDTLPTPALGDKVTVTGTVGEFRGLTQITATAPGSVEVVIAKADVPAAEQISPAVFDQTVVGGAREALESQLVSPTGEFTVSSSFQLGNFGSLFLTPGDDVAVKSTETTDAGDAANTIAAANRAARVILDDGYNAQVTSAVHVGDQPYFSKGAVVRTGDSVVFPTQPYVLSYGFDDWRLQPTVAITDASPADYTATFTVENPRTTAPAEVGGDVSVGAFNVLNYFTTLVSENPAARGAKDAAAFAIQRSKIISAITALDTDVVALMEIENSIKFGKPVDTAVADLVAGLNAAAGSDVWAFVPTPAALATAEAVATTDFITNAMIYKKAAATPVGDSFTTLDETVWGNAREPIAQTFDLDGRIVTAVSNHFKSKSGSGTEPTDGQGFFNADRVAQATAVKTLVDTITADPAKSSDVVLLGDFNAYSEEDPIQVFTDAGYSDLLADTTDDQYTYEFNGELGSLDHAIATPSLAERVTGVTAWTINSPEWSEREYAFAATEPATPYRSSDHDPLKLGLSTAAAPVAIDIVSINDFHGRLEASAPATGGAAVLGGMVDSYEAANPNTLFVSAGDSIGASTFTSFIQNDEPTLDVLNSIGLDATAFGNHEFDQGADDVDGRVIPNSDFPYLGANIYLKGTQTPAYDEYSIQEVDGVSVGFIGAITEQMPTLVSPDGIAGLDFGPIVPAVNRVATQLSDGSAANGEADVLVLLVHEGAVNGDIATATDASAFGQIVTGASPEIDAIISAHTHTEYNHLIPIPGTDKSRPVLQSGEYGEAFGHIEMSVDPDSGELLSISSERLPLFGAYPPDPAVAAIVADAVAVARVEGAVKVGDITADFNRAVGPTGSENRGGESSLGNFVADVQLWATAESAGSEIALMNPGGLRADLKFAAGATTPGDGAGVVTFAEAAAVQPFANTLVAMDLTTAQVKQVLEEQWQPDGATRPFLKLGVSDSLDYTYDPAAPRGGRVDAIYVDGELAGEGDVFRVTVNSFLASGGDGFATLALGTNRSDTGKIDLQSMVEYFQQFPVESPEFATRSFGVALSAPDADGYGAGDEVTVSLSSLLVSNNGPTAATAVVSLDGSQLGSAPIDPTPVLAADEGGRATVTFAVPDGAAGPQALTVTVPETGATVQVPIEFTAVVLEPVANVALPTITGSARVGQTLTATPGTWSVDAPSFTYQWERDGVVIEGATAATYTAVGDDVGAAVTVVVTASAEGFTPGTAESAAVTVQKATSTISGSLNRLLSFGGSNLTYTATVRAPGVVPTGDVYVYDGSRRIASAVLETDDAGRVTIALPTLSRGIHLISARYAGDTAVGASLAFPRVVLVF